MIELEIEQYQNETIQFHMFSRHAKIILQEYKIVRAHTKFHFLSESELLGPANVPIFVSIAKLSPNFSFSWAEMDFILNFPHPTPEK